MYELYELDRSATSAPPTTPNPFQNFSNLYTNHKKQPLSSTYMKPGTTSQQHKELLIKGRGTLQEPIRKKQHQCTTTSRFKDS